MNRISSNLDLAIEKYKNMLDNIDFLDKSEKSKSSIVELLLYRNSLDTLWEKEFSKEKSLNSNTFVKLSNILDSSDEKLRKNGKFIKKNIDLNLWREKIKPPKTSWWWYFETNEKDISIWLKFDWLWNVLTAVTLAVSASFMINIYSAISMGNANFAVALSTIFQVMGLTLVSGGMLSSRGQESIKKVLNTLHIPKSLFAEVTFTLGFILMCSTYYFNSNLDTYFYDEGIKSYEKGAMSDAILYLSQAKKIDPYGIKYDPYLGKAYESLGDLPNASKLYLQSVQDGNYEDLISLGRVFINKIDSVTRKRKLTMGESYLLLGMQRLQTHKNSEELLYEARTNMGWVLLEQKKYSRARDYLETAIERYKTLPKLQKSETNQNMAFCFLAEVNERENRKEEASKLWLECIEKAKPEFVHQYNWFMKVKQDELAYCINTIDVTSGFHKKREESVTDFCQSVKDKLKNEI